MKIPLLVLTLFCASATVLAQTSSLKSAAQYSYIRIHLDSPQDLERLQRLGIDLDHAPGKSGVFVETFVQPHEMKSITNSGFRYEILIEDWDQHYAVQKKFSSNELKKLQAQGNVTGFKLGSMGGFLTFAEVVAELDSMRLHYPQLISQKTSIGKSIENRDLWMVKISSSPDAPRDWPEVLYFSLIHAREPQSMMTLLYFMSYLLEKYGTDPEITYLLDNRELYFIPVVNPDGYVRNQTERPAGGGLWRKNRRNNGGSFGVDLNRNFGFKWGFDDLGSSGFPASEVYRGAAPFSEPETTVLRNFCRSRNFKVALNFHAFGNLFIYPYSYADLESSDSLLFRDYAREATGKSGYTYGTAAETVNYLANGDSDDWLYGEQTEKPKIIASTIEVGTSQDYFWPQPNRIIPLAEENLRANLHTAWIAGAYVVPAAFELSNEFPQAGDTIGLSLKLHNKGVSAVASQLAVEVTTESSYLNLLTSQLALSDLPSQGEISTPMNALRFVLRSGYKEGEFVTLNIKIHQNGATVTRPFTFQLGNGIVLLQDDAEQDKRLWRFTGGWGRDSSLAYHGEVSFKDRPHANSRTNANAEMTLATPLDLTSIVSARWEFFTQYAIESGSDFGQALISTDGGSTWQALSGMLTGPGNGGSLQPILSPGYDGIRHDWEKEEIRLEAFAQKPNVLLKFRFRSDGGGNWRGWYVDNVRVIGYAATRTAVAANSDGVIPSAFALEQNYPNPLRANSVTTIRFALPQREQVKLTVVDVLGRSVTTLVDGRLEAGVHSIIFDTKGLPSGIYYYRLTAGVLTEEKKLLVVH